MIMKCDIIISGVGGQGILSIAATIGFAAIENGLFLKQAEVHGMSQRGGAVQSHLRISSDEVISDLIPLGEADMILSVEPMESLRYLPWLSVNGWLVTNTKPFVNIDNYPPPDAILGEIKKLKKYVAVDSNQIAHSINSPKSSNMVILGAASNYISIPEESFLKAIEQMFLKKGDDVINLNIKAFIEGKKAGKDTS